MILQTMTDGEEFFSLEDFASEENLTLDPSACGNITAEYMQVGQTKLSYKYTLDFILLVVILLATIIKQKQIEIKYK